MPMTPTDINAAVEGLTDAEKVALEFCLNETMVHGKAFIVAKALQRLAALERPALPDGVESEAPGVDDALEFFEEENITDLGFVPRPIGIINLRKNGKILASAVRRLRAALQKQGE